MATKESLAASGLTVSMKSGLEDRNNRKENIGYLRAGVVSMKSGLEDRNNPTTPLQPLAGQLRVSMKSGLEDRNNVGADRHSQGEVTTSQ